MSYIDFWKKVIFANLVTYEVLHGQRRLVACGAICYADWGLTG